MNDEMRRILSGVILAAMTTIVIPAQALECPDRLCIYRSTTTTTNEIRFTASIQSVSIACVSFTKA